MNQQIPEAQWAEIYFQKKSQHNQYAEFKTKSFQYQKYLTKLHLLNVEDVQSNQKQIKIYIKNLTSSFQELKNICSEIYEEMKFLKFQNFASLIENFQQLLGSLHHYTIQDKKNKISNSKRVKQTNQTEFTESCQKCLGSINQINMKKLYDQITTTEVDLDVQSLKMTRQQRRKMISQLDEYDILIAQKQNYIRKVNQILENKGKVGMLSDHDKTYNFLSEYLSKIQKIQQKRTKSYNKDKKEREIQEKQLQQQSYKHILEYIKRVLFEHFVSQCSGPVKKMFQKLNIDKIFKSFDDKGVAEFQSKKVIMQNHETQTSQVSEFQQLKILQKKIQFKLKQNSTLKTNKDELEKKYITALENVRKTQSQLAQLKVEKKWVQSELKAAQQNLKNLKKRYDDEIQAYEEQQSKYIQRHVNQRQKILRISKLLQNEYQTLTVEHSKCQSQKNKNKDRKVFLSQEVQTGEAQPGQTDQIQNFSKTDRISHQRKRFSKNKLMFSSFGNGRKNGMFQKNLQKGLSIFQALQQQSIIKEDVSSQSENLDIESNVINFHIKPETQNIIDNLLNSDKNRNSKDKKYRFNKGSRQFSNNHSKNQMSKYTNTMSKYLGQQNEDQLLPKDKRIKVSMTSFKKRRTEKTRQSQTIPTFNTTYKFSHFNRLTEVDQQKDINKNNLTLDDQIIKQNQNQSQGKNDKNNRFQVSQRLYKKKEVNDGVQLPFQRVIEDRKQKFYIKKISRQSINYKFQKEKMKEISQILKPYMYNSNNFLFTDQKRKSSNATTNLKSIRQRLSLLGHKEKRNSICQLGQQNDVFQKRQSRTMSKQNRSRRDSDVKSPRNSKIFNKEILKNVGNNILQVQHVIESQYAYLKAVGFIDFIMKIGRQNKKMVKAMRRIQNQVKTTFEKPTQKDLILFGGKQEAENYLNSKNFWVMDSLKENIMIYNKNDGLSMKIQKYFNLLKRANPDFFGVLMRFLINPIFAVFGQKELHNNQINISDDGCFIKDLFNQLQKYHKIKHNQCTCISDFLQKIGFYRYTYF